MKMFIHLFTVVVFLATQLSTSFAYAQEATGALSPQSSMSEDEEIEILRKASASENAPVQSWQQSLDGWFAQDLKMNLAETTGGLSANALKNWALVGLKRQALEMGMEALARYSVANQGQTFCQNSHLTEIIVQARTMFPGLNSHFEKQCEDFKNVNPVVATNSLAEVVTTAGILVNQIEDQLFKLEGARVIAQNEGKRAEIGKSKILNDQIRDIEAQIALQNLEMDKILSGDPLMMLLSTQMKTDAGQNLTLADFIRIQQRKLGKTLPGQDQLTPLVASVGEKLPALMAQARSGVESFLTQAAKGDYEFFLAFPTLRAKAFDRMNAIKSNIGDALLKNDKEIASNTHFDDAGPAAPNPIEYLYTTGAMVAAEAVPQAALLFASRLGEAEKVARLEKIESLSRPWALATVGAVLLYVGGKAVYRIHKISDYQKLTALGAFVGANSFETARQAQLRKISPLVIQATVEIIVATIVKMKFRSSMVSLRALAEAPKGFVEFLGKVKNLATTQFWKASMIKALRMVASKNTYDATVNMVASLSMLSLLGMQARGNHDFLDLMKNDAGFRTNFWITAASDALLGYYGGVGSLWDVAFVLGAASALGSILGQKKAGVPVSWDRVAFDTAFVGSISNLKYRLLYTPLRTNVNGGVRWIAGGDTLGARSTIVVTDLILAFANNGLGNGLYDWTVRTQLEPDKELRVSILSETGGAALSKKSFDVVLKASELDGDIPPRLPLPLEIVKGGTGISPN